MSIRSVYRSVRLAAMALPVVVAAWFSGGAWAADPLGRFPVDPAQVSGSGISSGAFMANQLHIAHSAGIIGAGAIAGGLYGGTPHHELEERGSALARRAPGPCRSRPTLLSPAAS